MCGMMERIVFYWSAISVHLCIQDTSGQISNLPIVTEGWWSTCRDEEEDEGEDDH